MNGKDKIADSAKNIIEIFKIFRSYEEHENNLVTYRVGWLTTIQSVLIATFGFSLQKYLEIKQKIVEMNLKSEPGPMIKTLIASFSNDVAFFQIFFVVICIIGILVSISAYISINAALEAQIQLRSKWESHKTDADKLDLPGVAGGGSKSAIENGGKFAKYLPILLAFGWVVVIVFAYRYIKPLGDNLSVF